MVLAALAVGDSAVAAPPPAGALEGVTCVAGPSEAAPLGCQVGDATLTGIHEVVLGPGDAQLYVAAEQDGRPAVHGFAHHLCARSDTGALTRTACRDNLAAPGCVGDSRVRQTAALALSPDGADLYVADGALGVVQYRRAADGTLTFKSCVEDNDGMEEDVTCPNRDGLRSASAVDVSPDGEFVYVTGYVSNAVTVLDRNPVDGTLTFVECWASFTSNPDGCASTVPGNLLGQATDLEMTADGSQLYASSRGGRVVRFARSAGAGSLSDPQAIVSTAILDGAQTLLVAPGGEAVYAGLFDGVGLTTLARDPATGTLGLLGCVRRTANFACAASPGVYAVFGVGLSADGSVLYAAARNGGTVASFARGADGGLSLLECAHGALSPKDGCTRTVNGLDGAEAVAASSDGRFVYAGGGDAIVTLAPEYAPARRSRAPCRTGPRSSFSSPARTAMPSRSATRSHRSRITAR
jgi:6-phosphogluconolactonase (cycloisomerase 2 family)